jgi:hypothetical protein
MAGIVPMKILATFFFVMVTLLFVSCSKKQAPTIVSSPQESIKKWYKLGPGDEYVTDFSLEAGGNKPIEIVSDEPLFIGFKTDASPAVVEKYFKQAPQPVRLQIVGVKSYVGSVIGCGGDFPPVDGKLRFLAVNETDVPLRLVVFKHRSTSDVIWPGVKNKN